MYKYIKQYFKPRLLLSKSDYSAGYGIAIVSYVQMVVMCYTGQNVVDRVIYSQLSIISCLLLVSSEAVEIIFLRKMCVEPEDGGRILQL